MSQNIKTINVQFQEDVRTIKHKLWWSAMTSYQIQDGGRPPFWKSIIRNNSAAVRHSDLHKILHDDVEVGANLNFSQKNAKIWNSKLPDGRLFWKLIMRNNSGADQPTDLHQILQIDVDPIIYVTWRRAGLSASAEFLVLTGRRHASKRGYCCRCVDVWISVTRRYYIEKDKDIIKCFSRPCCPPLWFSNATYGNEILTGRLTCHSGGLDYFWSGNA